MSPQSDDLPRLRPLSPPDRERFVAPEDGPQTRDPGAGGPGIRQPERQPGCRPSDLSNTGVAGKLVSFPRKDPL